MQGWKRVAIVVALAALAGCDEERVADSTGEKRQAAEESTILGGAFDPNTAGVVRGKVIWKGDVPFVQPFHAPTGAGAEAVAQRQWSNWNNPHAPTIDSMTKGIADVVVLLRGVELKRSKPWDLPPVVVEQRDYAYHVRQGPGDSTIGFVRRGDAIEMVSRQPAFHLLHAHGAAYFSLAFPDPDRPLSRRLQRPGLVELSSAAGYFWMRGYLFVDDHPYYTRTDATGAFSLDAVPPGEYELVCWLPNWHIAKQERDPETALVSRIVFHSPVELTQPVLLQPMTTVEATFSVSPDLFAR